MKKRLFMSFVGLILCIGLAVAQVSKVSGIVTSAETGEPIIGATVLVEGTTTGSITDIDGKFAIANIPANAKNLMVSYVGMKTMRVAIQAGELKIELRPDTEVLDEVVVTAMGISREKKALGYALQEVKSDQITQAATMNVANALSGKVAGVQITSQGGQIGASQNIVIRGNSSFGNNAPLIVVDGVPIQNDNGTGSGINLGSGMNDINPEDIESISVLKGGSAALYGMRAGNGVVLITTKSGKKDKGVRVSYDGSFTVDQIYNLPKLQNKYGQGYYGSEYDWVEGGYKDAGMSYADFAKNYGFSYYDGSGNGVNDNADESWGPRLDIGLELPQYNSPVVDGVRQATPWVSNPDNIKNFFDTGYSQNHVVSLTTAGEKSSTRASLGFRDQKGTTPNTDQKRYSAALNTHMAVNKFVDFDLSANFIRTQSDNLPVTGYNGTNPLQSLLQWHGRQIDTKDLFANMDQKDEYGNYTHYNWQNSYATNPYWSMYHNLNKYTRDRFYGKTSIFVKPTDWLKFEARLGFDHFDSNQFSNIEWSVDYPEGYFRNYDRRTTEINGDFIAYFNKNFGKLSVNALAGANYRDYNYEIKAVGADNLTVQGLYTVANAKGNPYVSQNHELRRSNSVYSNFSFGWDNQAYLDISLRNDWDSTLDKSFFYPSFSGSWLISETFPSLVENQAALSFLKLRGGWAKIGNATDPYRLNSYYSVVTAPFQGNVLYYNPTTYPAQNLRPEMVKTWEAGLEANFLNNRIRLDAAYYQRVTTDQIMSAEISNASGYTSMYINAGKVSNKGIEVSLSADIFKNENGFSWTSTLNWSKDKSRIDKLYTDSKTGQKLDAYVIGESWSCINYAIPGKSWGTLVGTGYVYNEDGSILVENGVPVYEADKEIGDVTPDWLAGWSNEFSYKNWSFGFMLDYRKGGDVYSVSQAFGSHNGIYDYTAAGDIRENGVIAGKNVLTDKVFKNADGSINTTAVNAEDFFANFYSICEMSTFDGSYLKLREAHITYKFPQSVLKKTKFIRDAHVSLVGNNLALLWVHSSNLTHMDPESTTGSGNSSVGFESNAYPPSRSFGLKVGVTF